VTVRSGKANERVLSPFRALKETPAGAKQAGSRVTSVVGGSKLGTVAVVPNVAVQGGSNGALAMSERWHAALLAHSSDLIAVVDDQARVIYANEVAEHMLGFVPDDQRGRSMFELIHPDDLEATVERFFAATRQAGTAPPAVFRFKTASGDWRVLEATATNCLDDPAIKGIVVNAHDVTEQTNLSRALRTMGQGNQVLVRATSEASLLADMCQTIVASGGYLLAWVGYVGHDEAHTVRPVASAGRTEYLNGAHFGWGDDDLGRGPTGTAIRTRSVQVLKDMHRSRRFTLWRAAATACGLRTSCSLPLVVDDVAIGALMIYAGEPGTFGQDEVAVLLELADDLAYGIGRLRDADRLAHAEALFREAERLAHVGHWEWDLTTGRFEFMADEVLAIHGTTPAEWKDTFEAFLELVHPEDRSLVEQAINKALASGTAQVEHRIVRPDGEVRFVRERTEAFHSSDGKAVRIVGTCQDITDQKAAETTAEEHSHFLEELLEALPVPVFYKDATLHYAGCNEAYANFLGRSKDDVIGKTVSEVMPEFAKRFNASDRELLSHPHRPVEHEVEFPGPEGTPLHVACHKAAFFDVSGKLAGIVGVNLDLTEIRRSERELAASAEKLTLTLEGAITALGATTELRDPYTAGHQRRVAELACAIGIRLGWNEARLKSLHTAAVLHDIGKIVLPAEILAKPGRLSDIEMRLIHQHAAAGAEIVGSIGFEQNVAEIIRQHHERLDGSGYPKGLRNGEILPEARILAVADVVEAMISHRPYRPALPIEVAMTELEDGTGIRYDAEACETAIFLIRSQGFTFTT
jgi:PAS domain S-box-containing protein/putative nucleotidyltransferase with HDIG domain